MANEMPAAETFTGLSRKVIAYSEGFTRLVAAMKDGEPGEEDWAGLEALVDVDAFERVGVFGGAKAEVIGWRQYRDCLTRYGGGTSWEGTLRAITEAGRRVILELQERNTRDGVTDVANTVTIYEFDERERLRHLDVYVMPLG